MKISKVRLNLLLVVLSVIVVASAGLYWWYSFVLANLSTISSLSIPLILAFAFISGIISFFSPCGLALLPTVISYNLTNFSTANVAVDRRTVVKVGATCASGVISFYLVLGLIIASLGTFVTAYIQYLQNAFAIILVLLGVAMVRRMSFNIGFLDSLQSKIYTQIEKSSGLKRFYLFGLGYGLAIIGCVGPVVAAVILFPFFSGNFTLGVGAVLSYALALALMVAISVWTVVFSEKRFFKNVMSSSDKIRIWGGKGMIIAGIVLLIYYQFFELIPMYPLG